MRPRGENLVDEEGQLYTIEGVAAAILILVTVYIVLGTTTIYTPGDSHINDLQLEQVGNDALAMMDTPAQYDETALSDPTLVGAYKANQSSLENYIMNPTPANLIEFNSTLTNYLNTTNNGPNDHLKYNAIVWYPNAAMNKIGNYTFPPSGSIPMSIPTGREHFVRVTRLVTLSGIPSPSPTILSPNPPMEDRWQTVLLDVLIWRD